ncbi:anhydro-N-acetylmuramic acid kinase [Tahibacter aquaticus]|uniref:Anhydro-N-acetylmuramic acid kinase n=1 Tax=Tahibacter aquaticus TaxID=520092 RepID=A0A4R6YGC4_9GAMM|nr:anhydro-N-acetylmuramic acid kinase [Tahibacter aquaticus]TDR35576.1 anhydro-N-acetylmuramic acid kinase [Tahibacter aquaticus]
MDAPLYLGLISGTSADAIDVALARFDPQPQLLAALAVPYPAALRPRVLTLAREKAEINLDELGSLDVELGHAFADAALALLQREGIAPERIHALGSHGQTVRHKPGLAAPYTLQLGDPNVIAERTGIVTVGDFRRRDIAAGGQAAPLVPGLHAALLHHPERERVVLNLGGIANITVLPRDPSAALRGFDTGPANCLMDGWSLQQRGIGCDEGGAWAASGQVDEAWLAQLLAEPYFHQTGPKSSGREVFNQDWLQRQLGQRSLAAVDVQATLLALSARSVAAAIRQAAPATEEVLVCGGGVHNASLMQALATALAPLTVASTASCGVDPDYVEAMAFAWLARQRLLGLPGNRADVTGARGPRVLGAIYFGV